MSPTLATYVHDLSPFLLRISGNFGIRWYGFMYVLGFLGAFLLFRWFIKLKACELKQDKAGDFITLVAIFGIMLGGRLGYMLIYNRGDFFANPLSFFNFLGGGMASHGAIFTSVLVVYIFARKQGVSWLGLGDNLVITGALGLFFGRLGNFINGELYGRVTDHKWAMKFPAELFDQPGSSLVNLAEKARDVAPEMSVAIRNLLPQYENIPSWKIAEMMVATARKNEAFEAMMAETLLNPRHPSQLYQSLCEGLLVFLILLAIRLKWRNAYHGMIAGIFFIIYPIARILVENLREPDSAMVGALTKGQFYSCLMVLVGVGFIVWSLINKRQNQFQD